MIIDTAEASLTAQQQAARAAVQAMPLAQLDPADPQLFVDDTVGHVLARLRRENPVHLATSPICGPYWSVTRYQDIMHVDTHPELFSSCLGGSMAMNIGNCWPGSGLFSVMPPCPHSDEKISGWVSTCMMSW